MTKHMLRYITKYHDDKFQYRNVILPKEFVSKVPPHRLLSEEEWRSIGIQQSSEWVHYMTFDGVLYFRRSLTD